ncbi:kelch-like protein 17 isoform X2 [Myzus persicae]|uniref:kelch-like protein 17 isoform X2 n=1 Tax=Myzus persicae TaxID=13164 RepID=UPI000B935048|nr:kelch-like protein 17 isoform X2 [Myzus persicae]
MASPESKRIRLSSQDVENIANDNEVQTNIVLKIPNGLCYKKFDEMRSNKQLCDIKIIAKNGAEIWAHKVVLAANSEYFNIMFNSKFKESKELEIQIQELDPNVLSLLIDFIYSSELVVNEQNVQEILNGICLLQLDESICCECIDYIKSRIDPANCLGMKEMAECLGLSDFYTFCLNYTLVNFKQVYKNEEFLLITFDKILQLIKSEDLCVNDEKVYKSVMKWIKYDRESRCKHLPDLMKYVRLPIVSSTFFECTVDKEPLLKFNNNCRTYLNEAYAVHSVLGTEFEAPNSIRTQYRSNYSEYVLLMSKRGKPHLPLLYNIVTNQWRTLPTIIPLDSLGLTILLDDGRFFNLGGVDCDLIQDFNNYENYHYDMLFLKSGYISDANSRRWKPIQQMHKSRSKLKIAQIDSRIYVVDSYHSEYYNIECNKWFKISSLNIFRTNYRVVALNGFLYAVGGHVKNYEVKFVEQYDPKINIWKSVAPMLHGRSAPTLCALNGCMYAIGGKQFFGHYLTLVEKYDPSTDSWVEVAKLNYNRSNAAV